MKNPKDKMNWKIKIPEDKKKMIIVSGIAIVIGIILLVAFYILVKDIITGGFFINKHPVQIGGAHGHSAGSCDDKSGDADGNETSIIDYKDSWIYVIRPKDENVAKRMVYACKFLCDNTNVNVGYTQNIDKQNKASGFRYTLFNAVVDSGGDLDSLKGNQYDSDCSAFVSTCMYYGLIEKGLEGNVTTAYDTDDLETVLVKGNGVLKKQFDVVQNILDDPSKDNIDYKTLKEGDILLRSKSQKNRVNKSGGHTEIVVSVKK